MHLYLHPLYMYNTLKHLFYPTSKHPLNTPYTPYIHHCIHHYIHQARRPIAMRSAVPPPVPSMDEFEGKLNDAMDALWDTAESRQTEAEARLVGYRQSLLSDPQLGAMDRAFSKIIEQEAEDGRHLIATVRTFLKQVDPPSSAPSSPPSPPPSPPPSSPPSSADEGAGGAAEEGREKEALAAVLGACRAAVQRLGRDIHMPNLIRAVHKTCAELEAEVGGEVGGEEAVSSGMD